MDKKKLVQQVADLLDEYGYDYNDYALRNIINEWERKKANILEAFRKHPNWDEDRLAIILPVELERPFNTDGVQKFGNYIANKALEARVFVREVNGVDLYEWRDRSSVYYNVLSYLKQSELKNLETDITPLKAEIGALYSEAQSVLSNYKSTYDGWMTRESYEKKQRLNNIASLICAIHSADDSVINERMIVEFNEAGFKVPHTGAKTSREIRKLCEKEGIFKDTERNARGSLICEQEFANFADALNKKTYKETLIISVNPLDYWTMSFGHNWSSCHTIDKNNRRPNNGGNHYNGCYSGGTESYMLDSSTFIVYTGDMFDKIKRNNFHVSEHGELLCQGRLYPDGRDGGDAGLPAQFRHYVQEVVAQCYGMNNEWTIKKGTSACGDYISQYQPNVNYEDFFHYDDCNITLNRQRHQDRYINVGSDIICPVCGERHTTQEWITCEDCRREVYAVCDECGEDIFEGDDYIYTADGRYFCCADCAENAGYRMCYDDDEWHDDWFEDPYDGEYYHEASITLHDGTQYGTERNAIDDGCVEAFDNGEWYNTADLYQHSDGEWYTFEEEENEEEVG